MGRTSIRIPTLAGQEPTISMALSIASTLSIANPPTVSLASMYPLGLALPGLGGWSASSEDRNQQVRTVAMS